MSTSMENNTPPIGEPKATATPAALAAVTISLILPTLHQSDQASSIQRLTLSSAEAVK